MVLHYLEIEHQDDVIGPNWHTDDKFKLGLDFPNLPYYCDPKKSVKLTQSNAILMHIARTNDLWPRDEEIDLTSFCSPRKSLKK